MRLGRAGSGGGTPRVAAKPKRARPHLGLGHEGDEADAELLRRRDRRRLTARFNDQRLGVEVAEVELEFVLTIGGIERRRGRRGRDGKKRRRHFGAVRQHNRDPIAAADPKIVQRPDRAIDQRAQCPVAQRRRVTRGDGNRVIAPRCDEASQGAIRAHGPQLRMRYGRVSDIPLPLLTTVSPRSLVTAQIASRCGVATLARRASSVTEPKSASISIARPCSISCSIEVLCAPMLSAPAMRLSMLRRNRMPNASPTVCASRIIAAASARVGANRQMSSSVAWLSALTGLKVRLPQSFIQISERTSLSAGDLKPAFVNSSDSAAMRSVLAPSISASGKRWPSTCRMTPGLSISAAW